MNHLIVGFLLQVYSPVCSCSRLARSWAPGKDWQAAISAIPVNSQAAHGDCRSVEGVQAGDAPGEIRRGVLQGQQSARTLPPATVYVPGVYVPAEASPRPRREVLDELPACGECSGDEADV